MGRYPGILKIMKIYNFVKKKLFTFVNKTVKMEYTSITSWYLFLLFFKEISTDRYSGKYKNKT